jgi:phosphate transport system ATP-binding protein
MASEQIPPKILTMDAIDRIFQPVIKVDSLHLHFGKNHVLKNVQLEIPEKHVTALIGPSGCGKSTLLRAFNRMHDLSPDARITGSIHIYGKDIYAKDVIVNELRKKVGMVFQKPNPFPKSIYENVAYALGINGYDKSEIAARVEDALNKSYLWNEVKDKLQEPAKSLSGGQQQRLCIARAIAVEPEIILMDEPCSALDPISTEKIETLIREMADSYTIVMVTHNMQQAQRVADYTAFMYLGELLEFNQTHKIFHEPLHPLTQNYVKGHFG